MSNKCLLFTKYPVCDILCSRAQVKTSSTQQARTTLPQQLLCNNLYCVSGLPQRSNTTQFLMWPGLSRKGASNIRQVKATFQPRQSIFRAGLLTQWSQSLLPEAAARASPGNFAEMHIVCPLRSARLKTLEMWSSSLRFHSSVGHPEATPVWGQCYNDCSCFSLLSITFDLFDTGGPVLC
jgi:hypothetical protein